MNMQDVSHDKNYITRYIEILAILILAEIR